MSDLVSSLSSPDHDLISSPRLLWYNPVLDHRTQDHKMTEAMAKAAEAGDYMEADGGLLHPPDDLHPFNLISSLCRDGMHRPAFDVDLDNTEDEVRGLLVPSCPWDDMVLVRSSRFWHVYMPLLTFDLPAYLEFLRSLSGLGIVEPGYVSASEYRGQSLLRPPHIKKRVP